MKAKRIAAFFLILLTTFSLCVAAASADSCGVEYRASTELNVRSGPGMRYPVIGTLQTGEAVQDAGRVGKWLHIQYDGEAGYVFSAYLIQYKVRYSAAENLCVRTGPGTNYPIIGLLKEGESVLAGNRIGQWRRVSYLGQNGYVFARYLTADAPQTEWPPEEPALEASAAAKVNSVSGLTLELKQTSFRECAILLEPFFINKTQAEYSFELPFAIEKQINGQWYILPADTDTARPMLGFFLAPGADTPAGTDKLELAYDFSGGYGRYGKLTEGEYRMVWELENDADGRKVFLAAEFTVEADAR